METALVVVSTATKSDGAGEKGQKTSEQWHVHPVQSETHKGPMPGRKHLT
jgi:hypothetical protein